MIKVMPRAKACGREEGKEEGKIRFHRGKGHQSQLLHGQPKENKRVNEMRRTAQGPMTTARVPASQES